MARTKEFDENEVLDRALTLFRARGFRNTSFAELTQELGVSRQSLYDTYGDKEELFHRSLRRYSERGLDAIRRCLQGPGTVREAFTRLLESVVADNCSSGSPGCFMTNAMVEMAPNDATTRALAQAHARELEAIFASRICAAQRAGEIDRSKDPIGLSRFLNHTLLGLSVAARALGERENLRETAQQALRALD